MKGAREEGRTKKAGMDESTEGGRDGRKERMGWKYRREEGTGTGVERRRKSIEGRTEGGREGRTDRSRKCPNGGRKDRGMTGQEWNRVQGGNGSREGKGRRLGGEDGGEKGWKERK